MFLHAFFLTAQMNANLCDRFSVGYYPMLLWGRPVKFAAGKWSPKQEHNEIQSIDGGRTADQLLHWINKKMGRLVIVSFYFFFVF